MKDISKEWIEKAEEDLLVAIREFKLYPPAPNVVCFHAQQCIEKYMKAILQENDIEFEKTHDLDMLLASCKRFLPELESYRDDLIKLSVYAVDVRYPGFNITEEDAKECIEILNKIVVLLKQYFKSFPL